MSYNTEREEFIVVMLSEGMDLGTSRAILRDANTVQRLAAEECNRELRPAEVRRANDAERRITERCAAANVRPEFSGDPRGACVKLRLPSGRSNSFGGDGLWCVPTRNY